MALWSIGRGRWNGVAWIYDRLNPSLEQRCLEYNYTKLGRSIYIYRTMHIYPWPIDPPIEQRCLEYCYTKLGTSKGRSIYIYRTMHIYPWQMEPPLIEHRCLQYCYTKFGRSIYIEQCTYTYGRLTPLAIEHRCLEYHYTKLGRSIYIEQCIYTHCRLTCLQSSIDALNTATPNLPHLMSDQCIDAYGRWTP